MAEKRARKEKPKGKKKTWASPRMKSGQLFEANSLACGKTPDKFQCQEQTGATQS